MIIGIIDFNNPKRKFKYRVNWENIKDCIYDYCLERRHVVLRCDCGQILAPFVELAGPRACGWHKIKNKWKCHQCNDHNKGYWDGNLADKEEFMRDIKERNERTLKLITRYKIYHPWVRIKRI